MLHSMPFTDLERDAVELLIALDGLQAVVSVPADAFVHREQEEVQAVTVCSEGGSEGHADGSVNANRPLLLTCA